MTALTVTDDGNTVLLTVPCSPVAAEHTIRIPTTDLEQVVSRARAEQLGADSRGDL